MAFGKDDCDKVYSKKILPILRELRLNPIRVDRRQHYDDLNNFIIRMLRSSDIVLADLTYARPSVYYEAGFAERSIPVAYIVRDDHLSRKQTDDRLRVHFDLEMKKIITWSSPSDITFQRRLKARLKYLIRPILTEKNSQEIKRLETESFHKLSMVKRCEAISSQFIKRLRARQLWFRTLHEVNRPADWRLAPSKVIVGAKMAGRTAVSVTVAASQSFTKKQIQDILQLATGNRLIDCSVSSNILRFDEHVFLCSLSPLPSSRLTSLYPSAIPDKSPMCFCINKQRHYSEKPRKTIVWLLGAIASERQAGELANQCIARVTKRKTNKYTTISMSRYGYNQEGKISFEKSKYFD
jgi:nucleoside 2-deoxyribosyltransferase